MIIINGEDFSFRDTCVTIGKFDTLHIGHRALMERMDAFRSRGLKTAVLRLDMEPRTASKEAGAQAKSGTEHEPFGSEDAEGAQQERIRTEQERIELLEALGIDIYIRMPFTDRTAHMSPEDFVRGILVKKLGAGAVVVGDDFRFGYERAGDTEFLKREGEKYGFETVVLERIKYDGRTVSSSLIRQLIREGKLEEAYKMLGTSSTFS